MKKTFLFFGFFFLSIAICYQTQAQERYQATWESLKNYTTPDWYRDVKFGIFIHWGVYSVPAFGSEWYPRLMYQKGTNEFKHHIETYGPQNKFGYKDFISMFKAEKFNPQQWVALFKKAGAKYVVLPWLSTTMVLQCIKRRYLNGMLITWGQNGM